MDTNTPMSEERPTGPSMQILVTAASLVCAVVAGVFAYYLVGDTTDPERECVYRGGHWTESDGCVFESADGTTQVGMRVAMLTVGVPESDAQATFPDVEIGSSEGAYSAIFVQGDGLPDGSVALMQEFARVEKTTGDLLMPFAVSRGGSGVFTYIAIFTKEGQGYMHTDSLLVGDRIGVESLSIGAAQDGVYSAKLLYRDRLSGEPMGQVPRDPRTLEMTIFDHRVDRHFVVSRDGVLYKDLVSVKVPALHGEIASPLTVQGMARGMWFSEASFPLTLVDWDGKIIAEGYAQADGEWMTEDFVPFRGVLTFKVPSDIPYRRAMLILKKDNPSGMLENDGRLEIPLTLK